jgi:hypothetical protein
MVIILSNSSSRVSHSCDVPWNKFLLSPVELARDIDEFEGP